MNIINNPSVHLIPEPTAMDPLTGTIFPTSPESPFEDGFDLPRARELLNRVRVTRLHESHPLFALAEMTRQREAQLERFIRGSKALAEEPSAAGAARLNRTPRRRGRLEQRSNLVLHTDMAYMLFAGVEPRPDKGPVPSLFIFGAATTRLYNLSSADGQTCPWANVALCHIDGLIRDIFHSLRSEQRFCRGHFERRQAQFGIRDEIITHTEPAECDHISFMSPYGYQGRDIIAMFDYTARMLLTAHHVGLISKQELATRRYQLQRKIRGLFNYARIAARSLGETPKDEDELSLVGISANELAADDSEAQARVEKANRIIGTADPAIYLRRRHASAAGQLAAEQLPQFYNDRPRPLLITDETPPKR